jgi:hypothetical protein
MVSVEFFIDISFRLRCGPDVDSASARNEYEEFFLEGKGGRFVGLTTLPPSCADCLDIWKRPGTLRTYNRPAQGLLYFDIRTRRYRNSS